MGIVIFLLQRICLTYDYQHIGIVFFGVTVLNYVLLKLASHIYHETYCLKSQIQKLSSSLWVVFDLSLID